MVGIERGRAGISVVGFAQTFSTDWLEAELAGITDNTLSG